MHRDSIQPAVTSFGKSLNPLRRYHNSTACRNRLWQCLCLLHLTTVKKWDENFCQYNIRILENRTTRIGAQCPLNHGYQVGLVENLQSISARLELSQHCSTQRAAVEMQWNITKLSTVLKQEDYAMKGNPNSWSYCDNQKETIVMAYLR